MTNGEKLFKKIEVYDRSISEARLPPPAKYLNGFLTSGLCLVHILKIESIPDYEESSLNDVEKRELDTALGMLADSKDTIYGVVMVSLFYDKKKDGYNDLAKAAICIAKYLSTHPVKEGSDVEIVRMVREISAENNLHSMLDD